MQSELLVLQTFTLIPLYVVLLAEKNQSNTDTHLASELISPCTCPVMMLYWVWLG